MRVDIEFLVANEMRLMENVKFLSYHKIQLYRYLLKTETLFEKKFCWNKKMFVLLQSDIKMILFQINSQNKHKNNRYYGN